MMMTSSQIKQWAMDLGADLCGIAAAGRFEEAPRGFHPRDLFSDAQSVVVIAKRMPEGAFRCTNSAIPYTVATRMVLVEASRIAYQLSLRIEELGGIAMQVPTEPYDCWDKERREGRALLSFRHAGWLAGLGTLGKNTLLANGRYGNRIGLAVLLVDIVLEADPMVDSPLCLPTCNVCIEACPVGALDGTMTNQRLCRGHCEGRTKKNEPLYVCHTCREVCPNGTGVQV
jgi:epoxyqueuosine reductase